MRNDRVLAIGLIVTALVSLVAVALDIGGPVRALVAIPFVLAGPGLAMSLLMGTMSNEARILVAIAGSVATTTLVSLLLLLVGLWSGGLGIAVLTTIVLLVCVDVLRRDPTEDEISPTPHVELPG